MEERNHDPEKTATADRTWKRLLHRFPDSTDKQQDFEIWLQFPPEFVEDKLTEFCKDRSVLLWKYPELSGAPKDFLLGHPRGNLFYELDGLIGVLQGVLDRQRSKQPEPDNVPAVIGDRSGDGPDRLGLEPLPLPAEADGATQAGAAGEPPKSRGPRPDTEGHKRGNPPKRRPDLETSRKRVELCESLARELATVKERVKKFCDAATLKREYPRFQLWNYVSDSDIRDLLSGEFAPKAYANKLALAAFGTSHPATLKKDRRKLKMAEKRD